MKRNEFLKTLGIASATVVGGSSIASAVNDSSNNKNVHAFQASGKTKQNADKIKLGVSTYSYQHAIYIGDMTTEDCLAEMHSIGAETVQIIDGITVPNFPNPPESWVEKWFGWMDKYKLTPSLMDTFLDVYYGWRHKPMTLQEQIDQMVRDMKLAKRLGFKLIRPTSSAVSAPLGEWLDAIVPYAEEIDVKICPELHSPIPLKGEFVDRIMNVITKTGTKHIGFTLDMGDLPIETPGGAGSQQGGAAAYGATPPPQGAQPQGAPMQRVENDPEDIRPLIPYIYNTHGKFYDMADARTTETYSKAFKVLVEGGYEGAIDSEYEGQRRWQNQWCVPIDEVYQVRMHHVMMRKLLGRA
ncbi:MAG: TIM barrel protein [Bacteroidales bacterium]|nr:TIM barrel protein [Bacteroidales bacterium]